ncbi:MAG: phosphoribosylaminoimidazolesuccinocarboxamide synthase [Syntrophales bacterium]|jgi:phosphoribosylaminoimidazole-succinocarboxamide synthase
MKTQGLIKTEFTSMNLVSRGKVRDIYDLGTHLLIVTSDRISAFDVVMPNPVPGKGKILNSMSVFWFKKMADLVPNHMISTNPDDYPEACRPYHEVLKGRSMLVKKARALPLECIIRGYLSGSGWKDYQADESVSGIKLPKGLRESERLPTPIFTPSTKAEVGQHDQAISRQDAEGLLGSGLTRQIMDIGLAIYNRAAGMAEEAGIIIADTKMEFGILNDRLIIIDELLTPDSSRFWPKDEYEPGRPQKSYDKQFLRDYLLSIHWDQKPPAPDLPAEIIEKTREKYEEAYRKLVG